MIIICAAPQHTVAVKNRVDESSVERMIITFSVSKGRHIVPHATYYYGYFFLSFFFALAMIDIIHWRIFILWMGARVRARTQKNNA